MRFYNPVNSNEMAFAQSDTKRRRRAEERWRSRRNLTSGASVPLGIFLLIAGAFLVYWVLDIHARYTFSLQSPVKLRFDGRSSLLAARTPWMLMPRN